MDTAIPGLPVPASADEADLRPEDYIECYWSELMQYEHDVIVDRLLALAIQ
jgi:hypothetical protein